MEKSNLAWLQDWYVGRCDGDWEHEYGVEIGTLDNPGWSMRVDIGGTLLSEKHFKKMKIERAPNDWLVCEVVEGVFKVACGPRNLEEAIGVLRGWVGEDGVVGAAGPI